MSDSKQQMEKYIMGKFLLSIFLAVILCGCGDIESSKKYQFGEQGKVVRTIYHDGAEKVYIWEFEGEKYLVVVGDRRFGIAPWTGN